MTQIEIGQVFDAAIKQGASDIHIVPGYRPTLRVHGELKEIGQSEILSKIDTQKILSGLLTPPQKDEFETNLEIDFGYDWKSTRMRINYYFMKGGHAAAFRLIPTDIKTLEQLNLPSTLHRFTTLQEGLVLLTGPTGDGKSTTIAALIEEININTSRHVITIEDPIEYVYTPKKSIFSQRELHSDTHSWGKALRSVLREDPDIVLIGEMRDQETVQAALTIAETGHLVFSTLHTNSTPEAINRMIDVFPASQQGQIRTQLSTVLSAIIYQRLIPNINRDGRVPCLEILINQPAVASLIRDGKTFMIDNVLETQEDQGLILFEKYLSKLYKQNMISREDVFAYAVRKKEIEKFVQ